MLAESTCVSPYQHHSYPLEVPGRSLLQIIVGRYKAGRPDYRSRRSPVVWREYGLGKLGELQCHVQSFQGLARRIQYLATLVFIVSNVCLRAHVTKQLQAGYEHAQFM